MSAYSTLLARTPMAAKPSGECRVCGRAFIRFNTTQIVCSPAHGLAYARSQRISATNTLKAQARVERAKLQARRDALKPRSQWLREAQSAVNAWIRWRDRALPCVSCGRHHQGAYDAGHYMSVGARPELRYDEANIHKQCVPCNQFLHGNVVLYRIELHNRIGLAELERLEGPQAPKKYTVDELREIIERYRARLRREQKAAE